MKAIVTITILAALSLTTACSSTPIPNRYMDTAQTADPGTSSTEQQVVEQQVTEQQVPEQQTANTQTEQSTKEVPHTQVTAELNSDKPTKQPTKQDNNAIKKPTKQKVLEAKKDNESIGKAVTGSILDNGNDKKVSNNDPDAEKLQSSIERIRGLVKDLKQLAEKGDDEQIVNTSSEIIKAWDIMKTAVKSPYPDMADFLQEKIDKLNKLQIAETLDTAAYLQLDYELYQAFRQLADKAKVKLK